MNKIDFCLVVEAHNCNPNGDPRNINQPREDYEGYGEISDVCIKRKIRNRFQDFGQDLFIEPSGRSLTDPDSLDTKFSALTKDIKNTKEQKKLLLNKFIDLRAFGLTATFASPPWGIRGCVTIKTGRSLETIIVKQYTIAKGVNAHKQKNGAKSSDTVGKYFMITDAIYMIFGSINPMFADINGFTSIDLNYLKNALSTLFVNDSSHMRPDGSMEIKKFLWWEQEKEIVSSAKIHKSIEAVKNVEDPTTFNDYNWVISDLPGVTLETII